MTPAKMRMVYVAGKFTAPERHLVRRNIANAEAMGLEVCKLGLFPVIPHANTSHPNFETLQPYPFWIEGTLELMRRCDAVVMVPGWEESKGACGEYAEAQRIGLPVFESLSDLAESIGRRSSPFSAPPPGEEEKRDTVPAPAPPLEEEAAE